MIHITPKQRSIIGKILEERGLKNVAFAFGSRVRGDHGMYSDLDLLVRSNTAMSNPALIELQVAFKESLLPFEIDVVDWHSLSEDFRNRISLELVPF